jgi:RsiW-degrading membrane proteinase PrsW (M82 family)
VANPGTWQPHGAFGPPFQRRVRKVGAPLGVIIALGVVVGLIAILLTAVNPIGSSVAFLLATLGMTIVVLAYLWLDRWEPEPPRLLVFAFLWGASVAVVVSLLFELLFDFLISRGVEDNPAASMAIGAPIIEEAAKGAFLLLMLTGRRRNEMNSLTDCLVYAGLAAAGFAWIEDVLYISEGGLLAAAVRLIMGPFAHPLFTTMTGIGVYFAMQQRSWGGKAGCTLLGYLGAVVMHGLWNGSLVFGAGAYFLVYLVWMVPIFGLTIWLAVASRRREQRVVAGKLPGMVQAAVVTANEATWLGSLPNRKQAIAEAKRLGGPKAGKSVKNFAAQVVELAFVRDRLERGFGDARVVELQTEEAYAVYGARAAAPVLQTMAGYQAPHRR